jgi:hypothetical protein
MAKGHSIFTNNLLTYSYSDGHAFNVGQYDLLIETEDACFFFGLYYLFESTSLIPTNTAFDSLILDYGVKLEILLAFLLDGPFAKAN